jgi:ribosomal protein S19
MGRSVKRDVSADRMLARVRKMNQAVKNGSSRLSRASTIFPDLWDTVAVHDGKKHVPSTPRRYGSHRLGEFAPTRVVSRHAAPRLQFRNA